MAERDTHRLCCIIPAYNEESTIASVIEGCRKYINQVAVVDDGSTDGTPVEAEKAGANIIRHKRNLGKGAALRSGFDHALEGGFDAVITLDADGQHDPEEIPKFMDAYVRGSGDIIIGSRLRNRKDIPLVRYLSNTVGVFFISRAAGQHIQDTQSGFRLYWREAMRLPLVSTGFEAESEILIRAARAGHKISSLPIRAIYPSGHKSHIKPVKDFIRICTVVLKTYMEAR
jgi:glycosyltransferase involved in cell wall biosynthesis